MQDDQCFSAVPFFHQRVEPRVAQIDAAHIGGGFHAGGAENVHRISGLRERAFYVRQRNTADEGEAIRIRLHDAGDFVVDLAGGFFRFDGVAVIKMRNRRRQDGKIDVGFLHEGKLILNAPVGKRKAVFRDRVDAERRDGRPKAGGYGVRMKVDAFQLIKVFHIQAKAPSISMSSFCLCVCERQRPTSVFRNGSFWAAKPFLMERRCEICRP